MTFGRVIHLLVGLLMVSALAACGGQAPASRTGDNGDDDTLAESSSAVRATVGGMAEVIAQDGLHLRSGPSTSAEVITTMPHGTEVQVVGRSGDWDSVRFDNQTGWAYGIYLSEVSEGGSGGGGSSGDPTVDAAIQRAESGLGFSYHWGGGCWSPGSTTYGACYGNCPNCTHSGDWGADCSGYVSKIWETPSAEDLTACDHPYSTYNFFYTSDHWTTVPRSEAKKGDAFVRDGHIFLFDHGDAWGALYAYEAKGCHYGIVHDNRTADSSYKVIRRNGF